MNSNFDFIGHPVKLVITHCLDDGTPHVICLPKHPQSPVDLLRLYPHYLKVLMRAPDPLYITGTPQAFILLPLLLVMRRRFVVIELGDWSSVAYWEYYFKAGPKFARLMKKLVEISRKLTLLFSERYVTNSLSTYKALKGYKVTYKVQKLRVACPEEPLPPNERRGILVPVRLTYHKGVLRAILAYLKSEKFDEPLFIAGDGPLKHIVEKVARKIPSVKYLGFIPRIEVLRLMAKVKAVILPSYTEGFPFSVLEAVSCKVPSIIVFKDLDIASCLAKLREVKVVDNIKELSEALKQL